MKRPVVIPVLAAGFLLGSLAAQEQKKDTKGAPAKVVDPVCGMTIYPKTAAGKTEYQGKTYHFCSRDEKAAFDKEPQKYLAKAMPKK